MLMVDVTQDELGQFVTGFVVLDGKFAAQSCDHGWRRAFDRDKDVIVEVAAGDSIHAGHKEQSVNTNKQKRFRA